MPYMLKLDAEGGEDSCIKALVKYQSNERPRIVTREVGPGRKIMSVMLSLGYTEVKIVKQVVVDYDENGKPGGLGITSGPLGDLAQDCLTGYAWRSLADVAKMLPSNQTTAAFLCQNGGKGWYDWNFRHPNPDPPGLGGGTLLK